MGHGTVVVPYTDVCPNKLSLEESFRKRMETQWAQEDEMEKDGNTKIFTYSRDKSGKVKKELAIEDC
jgi:superfamily II helicase